MTLPHHPECKANEMQAEASATPFYADFEIISQPYSPYRLVDKGAFPFDGTQDYIDFTNYKLVAHDVIQMPSCEDGKFYTLGYTLTNEWGNASTVVEFLHCGLKQKITFPGFKRELSCLKCGTVSCFPDDFEF
jgi:hypothetical protein